MTVALEFRGGRVGEIADPLAAVGIDHTVNPPGLSKYDAIITDSLTSEVYKYWRQDAPAFYSLRGDLWVARELHGRSSLGSWLDDAIKFRLLDGIIAVDEHLAARVRDRPGNVATRVVGLPIDESAWPVKYHDRNELELLTLTNMDYPAKIGPLEGWINDLNPWLEATGSVWRVAGDGEYVDRCREWAQSATRVRYAGFVDAPEALAGADVLLHPSGMDGQSPNAILEAYASGVPVITNDHPSFVGVHETAKLGPGLFDKLEWYQEPEHRRERGAALREYVRKHHSPEAIGRRYAKVLGRAVDGEVMA